MLTPGTPGTGSSRPLRIAVVVTALIVLLALVAFASRSGVGSSSHAKPSSTYTSWALSVFMVLFVLMIPVTAYAYWLQARESRSARNARSFEARVMRSLAVVLLFVLAGATLMYHRVQLRLLHHGLDVLGLSRSHNTDGRHGAARADPTFQWPVLWVTLLLLAAAVAWWWWERRNRTGPAAALDQPSVADDMVLSIDDAIDGLEAEPDARRAVIAAYARMEQVFARHGMRRFPSETPVEYLRRLLLGLTSRADAVTRLTGLFEHAKFSRHEIDGTMKQDAIDALRAIRDDLQPA